jgi:hypothetical protein
MERSSEIEQLCIPIHFVRTPNTHGGVDAWLAITDRVMSYVGIDVVSGGVISMAVGRNEESERKILW